MFKSYILALLLATASAHKVVQTKHFASGMVGDEDLGQDIIMKGEKYHYNENHAGLV